VNGRHRPSAARAVGWGRSSVVALLAPALLGPTGDPFGDVGPCSGRPAAQVHGSAPDLVSAAAEIVELDTSVRFTLRFAQPLVVPDAVGKPFRIEVVLFDPDVPAVNARIYRGVNRILRYDAVRDPVTTTLLLPEGGQSRFIPPAIDGETFVLQVPGRTLVADEDETGTAPKLGTLRWSVVVRDQGACDLLGSGRPTERLTGAMSPQPSSPAPPAPADGGSEGASDPVTWLVAGGAAIVAASAYLVRRRSRKAR
jgi:hypothetical protein